MLRWLMGWCVPDRALRLQRGLDDHSFATAPREIDLRDEDVAGRQNLLSAMTSHGITSLDAESPSPRTA